MSKYILFNESQMGGVNNGTVLWENPNPTANFGSADVTLSQSFRDFEFIGVVFNLQKTSEEPMESIMRVSDFEMCNRAYNRPRLAFGRLGQSNNAARYVCYNSDTSLNITIEYNSAGGTSNFTTIPLQIIGY